ncbi:anaphase-promoting complex subunit 10 isoform X2 [Notamacropus eugenii]|uniref:anaphase-promoting complex subunit 10 isoform X2 n=1 Tax=Notamacropus eugenii TaxID=9315 RepID=UPI003B66C5E8
MTTPNKTPPGADPKQLERTGTVREIGSQAVWSLSSCKPGFGVDQLRDDNLETYWQSDGSQPHLVNIQFRRKTTVKTLCIYADYKSDESYTPSKISVRVGNNFHNLQEIRYSQSSFPHHDCSLGITIWWQIMEHSDFGRIKRIINLKTLEYQMVGLLFLSWRLQYIIT